MMPSYLAAFMAGLYAIILFSCAFLAIRKLPGKSGVLGTLAFGIMGINAILFPVVQALIGSSIHNLHPSNVVSPYLYSSMISGLVGFVGLILIIVSLAALPKKSE